VLSPSPDAATLARTDPDAEKLFFAIMVSAGGDDIYPTYHQLRAAAPALITTDGTLVLTRFADCDAALRHRALGKGDEFFRLKAPSVPDEDLRRVLEHLQRSMIMVNPPDHTRLRRLVSGAFTGGHTEALRGLITQRTDKLLAELAQQPDSDFMSMFALQLPGNVIADLLGVPESDRVALMPHILNLGLLVQPNPQPEQIAQGVQAANELASYFTDLLGHKRANPTDDLLSRLVAARDDDTLDDDEVLSTALLLFLAGNKTTADMLGNGLHALLTHRDQLQRLRDDRQLILSAADELLRFDPPMQMNARTVLEPVTVAGAELKPGQGVVTMVGAANRDPERFTDPDLLDVGRPDNSHLSFSSGIHYCLGAQLAKLEMEIFLGQLLSDYTDVTTVAAPQRQHGMGMRCFDRLPVTLHR
jgi:cytochrome P450